MTAVWIVLRDRNYLYGSDDGPNPVAAFSTEVGALDYVRTDLAFELNKMVGSNAFNKFRIENRHQHYRELIAEETTDLDRGAKLTWQIVDRVLDDPTS